MRRGVVLFGGFLLAALWLFGGLIRPHLPTTSPAGVLRFAHFGSYQDYQLWRAIIEAFERSHAGVRIQQEYAPGWYGQYEAKVRQQIVSGTLPHVVLMQAAPFERAARHLVALEDLADAEELEPLIRELEPTADATCRVASRTGETPVLRGLPMSGGNLLLYANLEGFEASAAFLGRPIALPDSSWTMEEFVALARLLTCDFDADGRLDQFGLWPPTWLYYLPFVWSHGAEVVDPANGEWRLQGPQAERAFAQYHDLIAAHRVCPRPAEVPQLLQDVGFLTGKVALCVNGPWFQPFLDATRLRDRYRVLHIPLGPAGRATRVTWDILGVSENTSRSERDQAWQFMRYCLSPEAQARIAESGRALPALRSCQPLFARSRPEVGRAAFVEALAYSRLQPRLPRFAEMDRLIGRHLQRSTTAEPYLGACDFLSGLARDVAALGVPLAPTEAQP